MMIRPQQHRSIGKLMRLCFLLKVAASAATTTETFIRRAQSTLEASTDLAPEAVMEPGDQGIRGGTNRTSGLSWLGVFEQGVVCGVVLVHSDIVITTAACATSPTFPPSVRIGSLFQNSGGDVVGVTRGVINPNYKPGNVTAGNDIAVMQLNRTLTNTVALMNEDTKVPQNDATLLYVAGFGLTSNTNVPLVLQELFYFNVENCFTRTTFYKPEYHMCGDASPKAGTCNGDSGTPAVIPGTRVVLGLNSFSNSNDCESQTIDVYTRMSSYTLWVKQQICDLSANPPTYCKKEDECFFLKLWNSFWDLLTGRR